MFWSCTANVPQGKQYSVMLLINYKIWVLPKTICGGNDIITECALCSQQQASIAVL